jgi:hypothetical protein
MFACTVAAPHLRIGKPAFYDYDFRRLRSTASPPNNSVRALTAEAGSISGARNGVSTTLALAAIGPIINATARNPSILLFITEHPLISEGIIFTDAGIVGNGALAKPRHLSRVESGYVTDRTSQAFFGY